MLTVTAGNISAVFHASAETSRALLIPAASGGVGYAERSANGTTNWTRWRAGYVASQTSEMVGSEMMYVRFVCVSGSLQCDLVDNSTTERNIVDESIANLQSGSPVIGAGTTGIVYDSGGRLTNWTENGQSFIATYGADGKISTLTTVGKSVQTFTWSGDRLVSNPVTAI